MHALQNNEAGREDMLNLCSPDIYEWFVIGLHLSQRCIIWRGMARLDLGEAIGSHQLHKLLYSLVGNTNQMAIAFHLCYAPGEYKS
jgi:hypothetical protein